VVSARGVLNGLLGGAVAAVLVLPAGTAAARGAGALDPTFAGDGWTLLDYGHRAEGATASDVLVTSTGKVVTVGPVDVGGGTEFGVSRLRRDGTPDRSFHATGHRTTSLTGRDVPHRVVALGHGRVLVAGSAGDAFGLAAFRRDGRLDSSFGAGGAVVTDISPGIDAVLDVRVRSDGSILAAGIAGDRFAVARYLADGTADPTFGDGGVVVTPAGLPGPATTLRLQPDGRLLVAGESLPDADRNTGFEVARFTTDGSPDPTFGGGDGTVTTYFNDFTPTEEASRPASVLVQPDGRVLVAGSTYGDGDYRSWSMARYLSDGSPDPSFGRGDGEVKQMFEPCCYGEITAVARQGDGAIVAVGSTRISSSSARHLAVARYTVRGVLDRSFSGDGRAKLDLGGHRSLAATAVATRVRGIVVAGQLVGRGGRSSALVARYRQ